MPTFSVQEVPRGKKARAGDRGLAAPCPGLSLYGAIGISRLLFFNHLFSFPLQVGNTMLVEAFIRERREQAQGIRPPLRTHTTLPPLPDKTEAETDKSLTTLTCRRLEDLDSKVESNKGPRER